MRFGQLTNGMSYEFEMQERMKLWLDNLGYKYQDEYRNKDIGRIADFLVVVEKKLINIEAKSNDFVCLINQMIDHAIYCDYLFAFIPDYSMTPKAFKKELLHRGFGLIVYNIEKKIITEVLEAHYNKPDNKILRQKTINKILDQYNPLRKLQ